MRKLFVVTAMLIAGPMVCAASSSYIVPTTTLAAQTSNNTSAANGFPSQSNGNRGAGNVSKVDVHTLLYSGATTKVYAHMMLWFGGSNHMNIGYNSADAAQVHRQITDMISRGINGVIIDWYGPNNSIDQATRLVMAEAESHPGFTFAIMIDQGAIEWDSCGGCTPQQALVNQLQYIEQNYFPSRAYMTVQGQPVVTNFNIDLSYPVDWNAANAALSTHPAFLFQNNDGFTHTLSDGSYAWVMPTTTDYGIGYLSSFYNTGMSFPSEQTVGATYKGFNDTLASWGSNRIMGQRCGETWLQTFSEINGLYSSGKQLSNLQLVTWNDYEEGTEIESGIDNCFSLSPLLSGNSLQWNISGDEGTVDHYTVYISSDGQNLMPLANFEAGLRSVNLCSFPIPNGNYTLFVQAVGKPSLANQITEAISYNAACSSTSGPSVALGASPTSVTIPAGQSGRFTVTAKTQSGTFNNSIMLSCVGVPANLRCAFSPASISPGASVATSTLTISAAAVSGMSQPRRNYSFPIFAGWLLPFGIGGFAFIGGIPRKGRVRILGVIGLVAIGMAGISCGGGVGARSQNAAVTAGTYGVTIQGNSSSIQVSTVVNVIVQ